MRILSILLCLSLLSQTFFPAVALSATSPVKKTIRQAETEAAGMHAAEILGISNEVKSILQYQQQGTATSPESLQLKVLVLRKILQGSLEVSSACNKLDAELTCTYDVVRNQQAKVETVNELFNLANFCQFGVLYSLEGKSRLDEKFPQSAILTCTSSGTGITLATMNILFNKFTKARDVSPPKFMAHVFEGCAICDIDFPEHIDRYMNSTPPGMTQTCKQEMVALWKNRYGVDYVKNPTAFSLIDKKRQSMNDLNKRILLLWSLHTYVQDFDTELLALLKLTKLPDSQYTDSLDPSLKATIGDTAYDAATLLNIAPQVAALIRLNNNKSDDPRRRLLEVFIQERILEASLERRVATDRIDEEINYANDVVLSQLLQQRGKWQQLTYEANFIQAGTFGSIAGLLYLKKYRIYGNEMFVISSGIGTFLTTLSLLETHGGWRKRDSGPNSLATFMNLEPKGQYAFPPVISRYLNSPDPKFTSNKSRRDNLYDIWKEYKVATMNMDKQRNREKVAGMPNVKFDTIRTVTNRVNLLRSVIVSIERLDCELIDLMKATEPAWLAQMTTPSKQTGVAVATSDLIGVEPLVENVVRLEKNTSDSNSELVDHSLALSRTVMTAALESRATASNIDLEIIKQSQYLEGLNRSRHMTVSMLNNLNFFQINILGIIIDGPLGLKNKLSYQLADDRLTIVSGIMGFCLGCAAFLAQHGGFRLKKAEPNVLAACFGLNSPANDQYQPLALRFLNVAAPESSDKLTRREELIHYWKTSKLLSIDVTKPKSQNKLAVLGPHHRWDENIKLIRNRLTMLFDLKSTVNMLDVGLTDILQRV